MTLFKLALGLLFILNTAVFTLKSVYWLSSIHGYNSNVFTITALALYIVNIVVNALLFVSLY